MAEDLLGAGAKITGGRWNEVGTPLVYASMSIAMAVLETIVHMNAPAFNRYLIRIDIPDTVFASAQVLSSPAVGWDAEPAGMVSVSTGQAWIGGNASALLLVPSAIIPEELNVLINPVHADVDAIQATKMRRFIYDGRLLGV